MKLSTAILDFIACFPQFALIAHQGIEPKGPTSANSNDRWGRTDTESNKRQFRHG